MTRHAATEPAAVVALGMVSTVVIVAGITAG